MSFNRWFKCLLALCVALLSAPRPTPSQSGNASPGTQAAPSSVYPNTTNGLQQLLRDVRQAARSGDKQQVTAFVKNMEVPDCKTWLYKMYARDKADSWMGLCEAKVGDPSEKSMQELFEQIARDDGEILTRKVNDNPEPGRGMEWGWLQAIKQPLDIYFASWKPARATGATKIEPIGYFMFVGGGFRWDSLIHFVKPKIGNFKIVPPVLIKKVAPIYPVEAAAQHLSGTVRVYYNIGADGVVHDATAISGEGLSENPTLRKAAEEAVIQWRFKPATLDGKPIEMGARTVDIIFPPRN